MASAADGAQAEHVRSVPLKAMMEQDEVLSPPASLNAPPDAAGAKKQAATKKAEEQAATKKAEGEAAAKKKADEEAAAKKAEEQAAAKKQADEPAAAKQAEEAAAAAKKQADEEAAAKKKVQPLGGLGAGFGAGGLGSLGPPVNSLGGGALPTMMPMSSAQLPDPFNKSGSTASPAQLPDPFNKEDAPAASPAKAPKQAGEQVLANYAAVGGDTDSEWQGKVEDGSAGEAEAKKKAAAKKAKKEAAVKKADDEAAQKSGSNDDNPDQDDDKITKVGLLTRLYFLPARPHLNPRALITCQRCCADQ